MEYTNPSLQRNSIYKSERVNFTPNQGKNKWTQGFTTTTTGDANVLTEGNCKSSVYCCQINYSSTQRTLYFLSKNTTKFVKNLFPRAGVLELKARARLHHILKTLCRLGRSR